MEGNLTFSELRERIAEQILTALKIEDFEITQASLDDSVWNINIEYIQAEAFILLPSTIALKVDAKTGELLGIWKGKHWE